MEGTNQDVPNGAPNLLNSAVNRSCASTEIYDEDQGLQCILVMLDGRRTV
jgi:hypothetical protein